MAYDAKKSLPFVLLTGNLMMACSGLAPEEIYVSRLSSALCTWARTCCELSELSSMLGLDQSDPYSVEVAREALGSQDRCVDLVHAQAVSSQRALLESIRNGRTKLDNAKLDACIQQYNKAKDTCAIGPASKALVEACKTELVFVGQQAAGAVCYGAVDCSPGSTCWFGGSSNQPGICRAKAAESAACRTSDQCVEADSCAPVDARDSWCMQRDRQAADQFCSIDDQCAEGLFCDTNAQACAALREGDQECTQNRQCVSNRCNKDKRLCEAKAKESEACASSAHCASGLWCDPAQSTSSCAVPLSTGQAGDACSSSVACKTGLACISNTCRTPLQDGQTCSTSTNCQPTSYCDLATTHTCRPRKVKAASCTTGSGSSECAAGLYCSSSSHECTDRVAAGQPCTSTAQCIEGTRCDATTGTCSALLQAGSSCTVAADCAQGLLCQSFLGRCSSRSAAGAMCDASDACQATEYCGAGGGSVCQKALKVGVGQTCNGTSTICSDGLFCSSGTCRQKIQTGQPCAQSTDCVDGNYCRFSGTSSCTPYATVGAACSLSGTTQPPCQPGSVCVAATDGGEGSACAAGRSAGQACNSSNDCEVGLVCPGSTCASPVAAGGACTSTTQCGTSLYCRRFVGSCGARIAEGQPCQNASACAASLECTSHNVCRAKAQSGEACEADRPCASGLRCDAEWSTCVPYQADLQLGTACRSDVECASGVCTGRQCTGSCQGVSR